MTFFNTKEEVVEIQLTPYGKHLLSKGQLKPTYYEFYDDDIIYDSEYAGITEGQDKIQQRIRDTKRTKAQYTFDGADTRYKEYVSLVKQKGTLNVEVLEKRKNFSFYSLPLGNASVASETKPATSIAFYNAEISSSSNTDSQGIPRSTRKMDLYPQELLLTFREKSANEPEQESATLEDGDGTTLAYRGYNTREVTEVFIGEDQAIEIVKEDPYFLIDISETEVAESNENFDFYLYEIEEDTEGKEVEKQIFFAKRRSNIVNNILLDEEDVYDPEIQITEVFAEYYFSILTDREIPSTILCKHLSEEQIQTLNSQGYSIDCAEIRRVQRLQNKDLNISERTLQDLEEC